MAVVCPDNKPVKFLLQLHVLQPDVDEAFGPVGHTESMQVVASTLCDSVTIRAGHAPARKQRAEQYSKLESYEACVL